MGVSLRMEPWEGSQLTAPGRSPRLFGTCVRSRFQCVQKPQPRADSVLSIRAIWALGNLSGTTPPRGSPLRLGVLPLPGATGRGASWISQSRDLQTPGDPGHTRPARWRAPLPLPRGRERAAVTSRATRQPRAPPGRACAAAEHMDPLVKRALQGQDQEKLRASMEPSTPRAPQVDIRVERMLAARVTSESRLDPPSRKFQVYPLETLEPRDAQSG